MIQAGRIFNYFVTRCSIKLQKQRTDRSVLHVDSRQQMEQLDFRKRRVMMVGAVCRSLEWMRMDNRRAILDMDVHK